LGSIALLAGCTSGPVSGTWLYQDAFVLTDSCDLIDDDDVPSGDFYIYNEGKGVMVVDPNESADGQALEVFDCTYDGNKTFDCPERVEDSQTQGDNEIVQTLGVSGTFDGREALTATLRSELTCSGPACAAIEEQTQRQFPCVVETQWDAVWTSPTLP
jgi:hypothetical protein